MNTLALSVTKWTGACDRRLARLISYIITQVITDNMVMWETRLSTVDRVYSKTQILLATLKTPNQPWSESYVSSEVKRQYPTVLQNQKLFRWMLV